ncbi:MAG: SDR family NAD(P)-dependent oxidoreductase [Nitrosopumilaceae archaeon]
MPENIDYIMKYDFSNKVVLVTGGKGALGSTVVNAFLAANATVIASDYQDNDKKKLDTGKLTMIKADLTNEGDVRKLVSDVIKKFGRIDILANVVGGYLAGKSVSELDLTEWDTMMNMNLKSAFLISKHVMPSMMTAKYGKIVHIAARPGLKAGGKDSAYSASKSGVIRLTESISEEIKGSNINVNCVMPSILDTEVNRKAMPSADFNKWVKTEDLANVILFLCSDESKAIHGAAIPVYGLS